MKTAKGSLVTCTLAVAVGACGASDRDGDAFDTVIGGGAVATGDDGGADGASGNGPQDGEGPTAGDDEGSSPDAGDDDVKFDLGDGNDVPGAGDAGPGDGEGCKYLDMLFVVDISGSMNEEKANLNANFPDFIEVLDAYVNDPSNGALGYRLGATNSSHQADGSTTGLDGELASGPAFGSGDCGTMGVPWLEGPAPGLPQNFKCLADNPQACHDSCSDLGVERPLDSMMGFIEKSAAGGPNDGFYRGEASLLVIVTLTDEDDQSTVSPAEAKAQLDAFTQGAERYVTVTVAGRQNSGCSSAFGEASPAPRLHEFTGLVSNGLAGDICQGDLTESLQEALELITFSCDTLPVPEG